MSRTRKRTSAPLYRHHKATDQAVVTIKGKQGYLGKYDREESHERYRRFVSESWSLTGESKASIK